MLFFLIDKINFSLKNFPRDRFLGEKSCFSAAICYPTAPHLSNHDSLKEHKKCFPNMALIERSEAVKKF